MKKLLLFVGLALASVAHGQGLQSSINWLTSASPPATPSGTKGATLYVDSGKRPSWLFQSGFSASWDGSGLTATRIITLPNAAGTLLLNTNPINTTVTNLDTITATAATNLTINAGSGNQNIVLAPTGTGFTNTAFGVRITGSSSTTFTGGPGLELAYSGSGAVAEIRSYSRSGVAYAPMRLDAVTIALQSSGTTVFSVIGGAAATAANTPLLLGTGSNNSNGFLQIVASTASTAGIAFGTDVALYRIGTGGIALDNLGGTNPVFDLREGGTNKLRIQTNTGNSLISANGSLTFYTNGITGTQALTLSTAQAATFAGSITTAAPTTGTAAAWKLGTVVTGVTSTFVTTSYVQLDVAGTLYKLGLVTSVP